MTLSAAVHEDSTIPPGKISSSRSIPHEFAVSEKSTGSLPAEFGDYELLREIARGGMGIVFLARQKQLNRTVALKMILAGGFATEDEKRRFLAEAESAASLNHPGIVQIFEVGCEDGQHFFSMEFVDGVSLAERMASGPLVPEEAARIMAAACDAIEFAHARGIVHRDLKPANVIIDGAGHPHIPDFGLARRDNVSLDTEVGELMGTVSYIPPEQATGELEQVGPHSDIYSLGATLYSLIAGHPPFRSASVADTIMQVIHQEPVPLRKLNAHTPRDLETICEKCLEKSPGRRYPSAAELAEDLRRYLANEPILARPASHLTRLTKWTQRNPRVAILAVTLVAAIVALYVTMWMYNSQLTAERRRARQSEQQTLLLMELRSSLVSRLQERSRSNSSSLFDRATELGRLVAVASQLAEAPRPADARELLQLFDAIQLNDAETYVPRQQTTGAVSNCMDSVRNAVLDWERGQPAPNRLAASIEQLTGACRASWESSADTEGASQTVRSLVAASVAQAAQLILTSLDRGDSQPTIERFTTLAKGTTVVVGLSELQTVSSTLLGDLNRWESGPPSPDLIRIAKQVRDLALVESTR